MYTKVRGYNYICSVLSPLFRADKRGYRYEGHSAIVLEHRSILGKEFKMRYVLCYPPIVIIPLYMQTCQMHLSGFVFFASHAPNILSLTIIFLTSPNQSFHCLNTIVSGKQEKQPREQRLTYEQPDVHFQ